MMTRFFSQTKGWMASGLAALHTSSIRGGKKSARAVLLTAPTKEMNRPNFGMVSASMTEKYEQVLLIYLYNNKGRQV